MNEPAATPQPLLSRLSALAEPVRLRLLALLESDELSVTELAEVLQLPQSTVSRHLKQLADEGWVVVRGERTANFHRMADGELPGGARRLWEIAREEIAAWSALAHDRLRLERVLAERRRGGNAFFAGVAEEWERLRTELYGARFTTAALLALLPGDWVVADLGCGSGTVAAELAGAVARVVGVDASPEMLRAAAARTRGLANVELREGDIAALPLDDESCDAALLLLALTHVPAPDRALAEMARILRPGGRAVVVDLLRHDRESFRLRMGQLRAGFAPAELEKLLAGAGLAAVRVRPLPPEPQAKGPALLLATAVRPAPTNGPRARERKSR
jgi:ArsR family transcriptional regulator